MEKKVSIIVPVYNARPYLRECADSLVAQTLDDIEIIFVDDASTDSSPEILQQYQEQYPNLVKVFLKKKNEKQGAARNLGIQKAQGKYLLFVDSDDLLKAGACEKLYQKAEQTQSEIVFCDYMMFGGHSEQYGQHVQNIYLGELTVEKRKALLTTSVVPWAKLLKREMLTDNRIYFPEQVFYEDQATTYLYYLYAKRTAKVEEALYFYRQRSDSTSSARNENRHFAQRDMALELVRRLKERGFGETYCAEIEYFLTEQMYCLGVKDCFLKFEEIPKPYLDSLYDHLKKMCPRYKENQYYQRYMAESDKKLLAAHEESVEKLISVCQSDTFQQYCTNYTYQLQKSEEKIRELIRFIRENGYRTVLWGAGKYAKFILDMFERCGFCFDGLVDRNTNLWGKPYGNYVVSPVCAATEADLVVIEFTGFSGEIRKEIIKIGSKARTIDLEALIKYDLRLPLGDYLQ